MGIVFEARDAEVGRKVALKLLLAGQKSSYWGGASDEERFLREARLSTKLPKHPHIVSVYEAGIIEGQRYLAMELIEGQSYSTWLKSGSVPVPRQVQLLHDVALAVDHAHRQGIIHRDLKPDNILLDAQNQPHVTDFGLAKSVGQDVSLSLTASGMVVGTPAYMSPEQALGEKTIDCRTDIYAMGVMLYEMLTGRAPFTGETAIEILLKAAKNPVPPPSSVPKQSASSSVDRTLETICLKCLAKNPVDRYGSAAELANDLERWLKGEDVRVKLTGSAKALPAVKPKAWISLGAAGAALLIVALVLLFKSKPAADPNEASLSRAEVERLARERPGQEDATAAPATGLDAGLAAYWRLDEGKGTTVGDSSGHKLGGKLVNGPRWVKRKGGNALHFDGGNSYVEISPSASLDRLRAGSSSVVAWYKPDDVPAGDGEPNNAGYRIVDWSWGGLSLLNGGEFMMQHRPPGGPLTGVASHEVGDAAGVYHHVAGVVDKATGMVITYVDGMLETQKAISTKPASEPSWVPWRIGIHFPGSDTWRWAAKGAIDSVRVYDRALSAAEIEALYRSEAPGHDR